VTPEDYEPKFFGPGRADCLKIPNGDAVTIRIDTVITPHHAFDVKFGHRKDDAMDCEDGGDYADSIPCAMSINRKRESFRVNRCQWPRIVHGN
jgi:hypothetical protein